ncbi:MAG TPA: DUF2849 domain-containing protein [Kiloniellaceae bacterium]
MNQHKSPKKVSLQVVTANRLRQGDVVYLTASATWSHHLNDGRATGDKTVLEAMLAKAAEDVAARLVVAPYAFEVVEIDGVLQPLSTRETIRAAGPTVRADHRDSAQAGGTKPGEAKMAERAA